MKFKLDQALPVLARTPNVLRELLAGLPGVWVVATEGPDSWSPYDIVGHLIHGERTDWLLRAEIILQEGESRPFPTFDRFAQFEASRGKTIEELLEHLRRAAGREPRPAPRARPRCGTPGPARSASRAGPRPPGTASGDVGGPRPEPHRAGRPGHGPRVCRRGGTVASLPADAGAQDLTPAAAARAFHRPSCGGIGGEGGACAGRIFGAGWVWVKRLTLPGPRAKHA